MCGSLINPEEARLLSLYRQRPAKVRGQHFAGRAPFVTPKLVQNAIDHQTIISQNTGGWQTVTTSVRGM